MRFVQLRQSGMLLLGNPGVMLVQVHERPATIELRSAAAYHQ
jgi:hypothetical protein